MLLRAWMSFSVFIIENQWRESISVDLCSAWRSSALARLPW
jgi:hypothetical protein